MDEPSGVMRGDDSTFREADERAQDVSSKTTQGSESASGASLPPAVRPFHGFDVERATYERLKPELLTWAEGQFVVVVGDRWAGPTKTSNEAEAMGYARFGLGPLYIKRVAAEESPETISRDIG